MFQKREKRVEPRPNQEAGHWVQGAAFWCENSQNAVCNQ